MFALSRQEIALVLVTMLWGSTFLVIHIAMQHSGPLFFVGVRFTLAGVVSMLLFRRHMARLTRREAGAGVAIGCALFLGYYLQTLGLRTITSSQSAFITALYVPIVPLLQWAVLKRPPGLMSWVGVALAFTGLVLLAGPEAGALHFSAGELATLAGAAAIAAEIILIGHFASSVDSRRVTAVQLLTAGLVSFALMPALGEAVPEFSWLWAGGGDRTWAGQRGDPADDELGAEVGVAHARHGDLRWRAGVGRHRRPAGRGTPARPGAGGRGVDRGGRAGQRGEIQAPRQAGAGQDLNGAARADSRQPPCSRNACNAGTVFSTCWRIAASQRSGSPVSSASISSWCDSRTRNTRPGWAAHRRM